MISALARLRALRAENRSESPELTSPEDLSMEWRIEFEERAAILEYDGGLSRAEAEKQALLEIQARNKIGNIRKKE